MNWESTLKKITADTALKAAAQWVDKPVNLRLINNQINCVCRFARDIQPHSKNGLTESSKLIMAFDTDDVYSDGTTSYQS